MKMPSMLRFMRFWPPFWGSGVKVTNISKDMTSLVVEMKLRWWNRNYVGTHFGGSLYAMTDPFYVLMLIHKLGREYIVWDKSADIRFKKPGKGRVHAKFTLSEEQILAIRNEADKNPKSEPEFSIMIIDEGGDVVAEVRKVLYVRRKDRPQKQSGGG